MLNQIKLLQSCFNSEYINQKICVVRKQDISTSLHKNGRGPQVCSTNIWLGIANYFMATFIVLQLFIIFSNGQLDI